MFGTVKKFNDVVFVGELSYKKNWFGGVSEESRKTTVVSCVKEVFDSKIYNGARCNASTCEGKRCPGERELSIVLLEDKNSGSEEMTKRIIMLHAYQNTETAPVFHIRYSTTEEPINT